MGRLGNAPPSALRQASARLNPGFPHPQPPRWGTPLLPPLPEARFLQKFFGPTRAPSAAGYCSRPDTAATVSPPVPATLPPARRRMQTGLAVAAQAASTLPEPAATAESASVSPSATLLPAGATPSTPASGCTPQPVSREKLRWAFRSCRGRGRRSRSLNNSLPQPLLLPLSMGGSEASRAEPSCWWVVRKAERPNSRIAPSAPSPPARRWFRPPNRRVQATRPPWLPAARSTGGRSRAKRRNTRQRTLGSGPHGRRCRHPENSGPCPTHAPWLASHSGSRPLTS